MLQEKLSIIIQIMDLAKFKLTKNDFFFVMRRPAGPDTGLIKRVLKRSCFRIMDSCLQLTVVMLTSV